MDIDGDPYANANEVRGDDRTLTTRASFHDTDEVVDTVRQRGS